MIWPLVETDHHRWLRPPSFNWPGCLAGFTTRQHRLGPDAPWTADWSFRGPNGVASSPGFAEFAGPLVPPQGRLATQRQVHGAGVTWVTPETRFPVASNDALLTEMPQTLCLSQSADCCVGLIAIPEARMAGVFHAGWRGAVARLPERVIAALAGRGIAARSVRIAIGPAIQQASYQVGPEVVASIPDTFHRPDPTAPGKFLLDLPGFVASQLLAAGVPRTQLVVSDRDTYAEPEWFHSYRRDGEGQGLQVGFIGWV